MGIMNSSACASVIFPIILCLMSEGEIRSASDVLDAELSHTGATTGDLKASIGYGVHMSVHKMAQTWA